MLLFGECPAVVWSPHTTGQSKKILNQKHLQDDETCAGWELNSPHVNVRQEVNTSAEIRMLEHVFTKRSRPTGSESREATAQREGNTDVTSGPIPVRRKLLCMLGT